MSESKNNLTNISKAIIDVMKAVKGMEKNSKVGSGSYAYDGTKDSDVKEVFNEELVKAGLCIVPTEINEDTQIDRWSEGERQKQSVLTKVTTKYLLIHSESGESIELAGYGHGVDTQDKAAGKATTYALKNCLLLTFLTPVGKMPDTETDHSQDMDIPKINVPAHGKKYPNEKQFEEFKKRFKDGEDVLGGLRDNFLLTADQEEWIKRQL